MATSSIGVPTPRTMGNSFASYGTGALGGGVYQAVKSLAGSGLIGSLAAPVLAGSVIKGEAGKMISVVSGFEAGRELAAMFLTPAAPTGNARGEM